MSNIRKRWRGKWVTEAVYEKRVKQTEAGQNRKKVPNKEEEKITSLEEKKKEETFTGYRLIDYELWKKHMRCKSCNSILDLEKTEKELRQGLLSVFKIRCSECLLLNTVPTSNSHVNAEGSGNIADINSRMALGALHAGLGYTQVEKMFEICGVQAPTSKTFKRREREVGCIVEKVAKYSCMKAAAVERQLTVKNSDTLSELFPDAPEQFFIPTKTKEAEVTDDDTVRIMASYDMVYNSGRDTLTV